MTKPKVKDFMYVSGKKYDGMMGRCYRPTDNSYKNYGAKGIRVCAAWITNIEEFRKWLRAQIKEMGMSEAEFVDRSNILQLDRKDPCGHYTPENCRMVSIQTNARNKKSRVRHEYVSVEGYVISV